MDRGGFSNLRKKIENNHIYWIWELGEPFSKKLKGQSVCNLKRKNLNDIDLHILLSSVWYEIDKINSNFADFIVTSDPVIKNYLANEFNINKNKIIENLNPNETISIETFIPNYKIKKLRNSLGKDISEKVSITLDILENIFDRKEEEDSKESKKLIEYSINIGAFDFLLENITKSENSKHLNKAKISEKDITFVLGQEPYIEDSSSKRIFQ